MASASALPGTVTPSPWVEIFRAGDYRGKGKGLITRADLERLVRNYDPTYHEVPVCIGHPANDKPAYAWVDRLATDGDTLLAREKQVDPQFAAARSAGRFKKRSAGFYQDAEGNITGLRHIAYLGAQPPEVKGLKDVAFDDHGMQFTEIEVEEETVADTDKTFTERAEAWFKEKFGSIAPKTFSEDDAKRIATEAATAAAAPLQTKITELETAAKKQAADFAEREAKIAGSELKTRAMEAIARLKSGGKWIPAYDKMGLGLVFDELAKSTETVEFGEGDAKKKVSALELQVLFLEGLPKIVPGGRVVEMPGAAARTGKGTGDPLTDAAKARQKEKNITFSEALDQVAAEQPELTTAGRATAGAV